MKGKRFDYIKYDDEAVLMQADLKAEFEILESVIEGNLADGRAKALALTKLEESYMWIGKAIRDEQIARGKPVELMEERKDG